MEKTMTFVILLIIGVIVAGIIGYLIGKNSMKPKGNIVFETYYNEDEKDWAIRCTFKLDLDLDEIIDENYILFGVQKNQAVLDYYKKRKSA